MPLIPIKLADEAIHLSSVGSSKTNDRMNMIDDEYSQSSWLIFVSSPNPFDGVFPTNESIMEIISLEELLW